MRLTVILNRDESDTSSVSKSPAATEPVAHTPSRPSLAFPSLPPSPAVVTDAIDRQTTRFRETATSIWDASGLTERFHALRSHLSSVCAIKAVILALEGFGLLKDIVPLRYLTTVPEVPSARTPAVAVKVPDLFVLVNASFWAPFSLWLTTSIILPYLFAYFFNLSLKISQQSTSPSHTYGTRRSTAASQGSDKSSIDPLVYNVAKALVSYLVYTNNYTFCDLYSPVSVERVIEAIPGGLHGLLTGSAIGTVGSLYEAILRK